ncbi:hypothetical protein JCGZ_04162 [Jatropha curcas]|uniref:Uncharacterized protein n=1 Tax=Jatropha curcas TaxID=180498 RepID=A0A067KWX2_JATCU|nr:hypothetical protein JCGZ_04162 [Jatropha curcas]
MAAKNVVDWLPGDAAIDPVTRLVGHEMKLWEFILDARTKISVRHDLPSHLYRSTPEIERYPWGDAVDFFDFVQATVIYQHRRLLFPSLFYDIYYLRKRVYEWELRPDRRRVSHDIPYYMLSTRSIHLEQDIVAARRGSAATDHLAAFV